MSSPSPSRSRVSFTHPRTLNHSRIQAISPFPTAPLPLPSSNSTSRTPLYPSKYFVKVAASKAAAAAAAAEQAAAEQEAKKVLGVVRGGFRPAKIEDSDPILPAEDLQVVGGSGKGIKVVKRSESEVCELTFFFCSCG